MVTEFNQEEVADLVRQVEYLKAERERAAQAFEGAQAKLLTTMRQLRTPTLTVADGAEVIQVTAVRPTTYDIDEDGLHDRIGDDLWREVSRTILDRKLLEAGVAMQKISALDVAAFSTEKQIKAYVKVTRKPRNGE